MLTPAGPKLSRDSYDNSLEGNSLLLLEHFAGCIVSKYYAAIVTCHDLSHRDPQRDTFFARIPNLRSNYSNED